MICMVFGDKLTDEIAKCSHVNVNCKIKVIHSFSMIYKWNRSKLLKIYSYLIYARKPVWFGFWTRVQFWTEINRKAMTKSITYQLISLSISFLFSQMKTIASIRHGIIKNVFSRFVCRQLKPLSMDFPSCATMISCPSRKI